MTTLFINNLSVVEWLLVAISIIGTIVIPFLFGYYLGLAKGKKNRIKY